VRPVTLSLGQLEHLADLARVAPHAAWRVLAGVAVCPQTIASVERAASALASERRAVRS